MHAWSTRRATAGWSAFSRGRGRVAFGVGVDISGQMVRLAAMKYPHLQFRQIAAGHLDLAGEPFDFIVLSDLVGYFYDIRLDFEQLRKVCHPRTRIVMHWYIRLWQPVLVVAEALGLKYPQPLLNWTTAEDMQILLYLAGFEVVHGRPHILWPKQVPLLTMLANGYLAHVPGLRWLCLTNWMIARPIRLPQSDVSPRVSVICPCRNEAGNLEPLVRRLPAMGSHTELILVEGHSQDQTLQEVGASLRATHEDITSWSRRVGAKAMPCAWDFRRPRGTF